MPRWRIGLVMVAFMTLVRFDLIASSSATFWPSRQRMSRSSDRRDHRRWHHRLAVAAAAAGTVNVELAEAEGMQPERARLIFMLLMALVIAIAMKIVGIMLITSLLIIPARPPAALPRHPS